MAKPLVIILAGGTGGHVYPALSVALTLRKKGMAILWLGLEDKIEATVTRQNDIEFMALCGTGIRGKDLLSRLKGVYRIALDCIRLYFFLSKLDSCVAVGFGGYSSFAAGIACWLRKVPLLIHEQNAKAGTTNKLLARLATTVCLGYQGSLPANEKTYVTGNPVRAEFVGFREKKKSGTIRLLVLGGSLGAQSINKAIAGALNDIDVGHGLQVVHQCGIDHYQNTSKLYTYVHAKKNLSVELQSFLDPMIDYYRWADMVICRAGAATISELAICRLPALLIPFPQAIDDHQSANAMPLVEAGAAWIMADKHCSRENLAEWLQRWTTSPAKQVRAQLDKYAIQLQTFAREDSTERVAELVMLLIANQVKEC